MALLEMENVSARYGAIKALKDVSLEVDSGQIVSLIGANGAGKTTSLRVISGLLKAAGGDVRFSGQSLLRKTAADIVGMGVIQCPEGRQVFARMSVEDNLRLGAYCRRKDADSMAPMAEVFELFPVLQERRKQLAGTLSGGEQQMLALGRALMAKPKLLLLDEPSLGLAPVVVDRIFEVVQEIVDGGLTVLLVEQNANLALSLSHHAYVLEVGSVTMGGTGRELLENDKVRAAYLGA